MTEAETEDELKVLILCKLDLCLRELCSFLLFVTCCCRSVVDRLDLLGKSLTDQCLGLAEDLAALKTSTSS